MLTVRVNEVLLYTNIQCHSGNVTREQSYLKYFLGEIVDRYVALWRGPLYVGEVELGLELLLLLASRQRNLT